MNNKTIIEENITYNNVSAVEDYDAIASPVIISSYLSPSISFTHRSIDIKKGLNFEYFDYFSEKEIEIFLDRIIENLSKENLEFLEFRFLIKNLIKKRHFSEDFLLKYFGYISENSDIYEMHKADLVTKKYNSLYLLMELKNEKI